MVPGMAHCGGGEGPDDFDKMTAIQQWVEQGKAPETMIASHADRAERGSHASAVRLSEGCEV